MKILAGITAAALTAVIVLAWLYVGKAENLATAQEVNRELSDAHATLRRQFALDQQKILERDREHDALLQTTRRLQRELDEKIRSDPQVRDWADAAVPGPVRDFVRDAQESAAAVSGTAGESDRADARP